MPKRKAAADSDLFADYRHDAKRKNIPPAALAGQGRVREVPKHRYDYNPHLPPVLRFDPTGRADRLPELLQHATQRPLTPEEARELADALRNQQPWLEWSGKREAQACEVDPVALHMHERVSAQAILRVAARQDVTRDLFADPEQEYREAVQFYQHDVEWANRLILGDSLQVMASLAKREDLAGKVQMIYMDPPYGIKFASNFQSEVGKRDVKDKAEDLTREAEMVKAYRDTWTLGVHSYLAYLRDRLYAAKELLADTGSVFVQIGDENLHRVRALMDEVFGVENHVALLTYKSKKMPLGETFIFTVNDYVMWYAKDVSRARFRRMYTDRGTGDDTPYSYLMTPLGEFRSATEQDAELASECGCRTLDMRSAGRTESCVFETEYRGERFGPSAGRSWKTNSAGMARLGQAGRLIAPGNSLQYCLMHRDYPVSELPNVWMDTQGASDKRYVVQTAEKIIERCMLMTTDPGDLVLDPTLGSGTSADVAEQWGRRWIGIDCSRVAVAIARQRLLTAKYYYYTLKDEPKGVAGGFDCKTVPHVTLKSIAQNQALDPLFAKWEPVLAAKVDALNRALEAVPRELRTALKLKLAAKEKAEGKKAVTDADRRRWLLPPDNRKPGAYTTVANDFAGWYDWEVPFDTDPDWPQPLQDALCEYRNAWRAKMDAVNASIAAAAEQEELVDQPKVKRGILRVSGPFTVEGVIPVEESDSLGDTTPIGGEPEDMETFGDETVETEAAEDPRNAEAYVDRMVRLLRGDGVRFPDNRTMQFARLERLTDSVLHADGEWCVAVPARDSGVTANSPAVHGGEIAGDDGGPPVSPGLKTGAIQENAAARPIEPACGSGGIANSPAVHGGDSSDSVQPQTVGVVFGPQHGPVTAKLLEEAIPQAARRGYDALLVAGFSFDAEADAIINSDDHPRLRLHKAHIRPDVNMGDLLKNTPSSHLFTVSGLPRTALREASPVIGGQGGEYIVAMEGVDIYDPVTNTVRSAGAEKVAAWFLDSDYDGRTFCITQAFFPDRSAWNRLSKALTGVVDPERFAALSGTESLPFPAGKHRRVAVKVIDPRGNEVMRVHRLPGGSDYA